MKCVVSHVRYCKILGISNKDHVTNEEVCAKIQQAIRPYKNLTIVKRCNLQWYGHVSRSSGFCQNHIARHSERGWKTRQTEEVVGRQHQEWTGMEFAMSQRAVENMEKWRKLVVDEMRERECVHDNIHIISSLI